MNHQLAVGVFGAHFLPIYPLRMPIEKYHVHSKRFPVLHDRADPRRIPIIPAQPGSVKDQRVAGGSLLVIHRGQTVLHSGFGYSDLAKKTPFPKNAPVVVASISKPLLGTAIFHLADAGKLDTNSPITRHLPEFEKLKLESGEPAGQPPTLQQILTHTSGMRNDTGSSGTNCWIDLDLDIIGIMLTQTKGSDITRFRVELEKRVTSLLAH